MIKAGDCVTAVLYQNGTEVSRVRYATKDYAMRLIENKNDEFTGLEKLDQLQTLCKAAQDYFG